MGNSSSRETFFKEQNINPYKYLQVSKNASSDDLLTAYKNKMNKINIKDDDYEVNSRLIDECYKYILDKIGNNTSIMTSSSTPTSTSTSIPMPSSVDLHKVTNIKNINFDDPSIRNALFVNHTDIDFTKEPKTFVKENFKKPERIFKSDKDFNINTFNSMFEKQYYNNNLHSQQSFDYNKICGMDASSSLNAMPIATYGGLIVEKKVSDIDSSSNSNPTKQFKNYTDSGSSVLMNIDLDNDNQDISLNNKFTDHTDLNTLYNKRKNEKVPIITPSMTFKEAEQKMHDMRLDNMKQQLQSNKDYVTRQAGIYPQHIREQFNNGSLENLNCIDSNGQLSVPSGGRKMG